MSHSQLYVRSGFQRNTSGSISRPGLIIGVCCGVFALAMIATFISWNKNSNKQTQYDPETLRTTQRRINGGSWGREVPSHETAVQRRARMSREARERRGGESIIDREAREQDIRTFDPPMHEMPAPAYYATPELRRQWLMTHRQNPSSIPMAEDDAPPAYDSTAVWPTRSGR